MTQASERFVGAIRIGARRSGARPTPTAVLRLSILADRAVDAFCSYSGLEQRDVVIAVRATLMGSRESSWFEDPCAVRWFESLFSDVKWLWQHGEILIDNTCKVRPVVAEDEVRYLELVNRRASHPVQAPTPRRLKGRRKLQLVRAVGGAS